MTPMMRSDGGLFRTVTLLAAVLAVPFCLGGCTEAADTGGGGGGSGQLGNGGAGDDGSGQSAQVLGLSTDLPVSGGQLVTIPYVVPTSATSVRAFRVPEGQESDTTAWEFFEFATPLSAGESQFTIDSADLPRGSYRIGVRYVSATGTSQSVFSTGVLHVQGLPEPVFIAPEEDVEPVAGETVQIIVDMGDPEADVAWRVFYISDASAPEIEDIPDTELGLIGNELGAGTGNVANLQWLTESVALGTYRIGVSATDTGFSVAQTASDGDGDRIVIVYAEAKVTVTEVSPEARPPTIVVTEPAANVGTFLTETVSIAFSAATFEGTKDEVTVFWDTEMRDPADFDPEDLDADQIIESGLTTDDTSASLSTATLEEDDYYLGAYVDDGLNDAAVAYAPGSLSVVKTPTLQVTAPAEGVVIRPSQQATISWTTNVPDSAFVDERAQGEVFVRADTDGDDEPDGDEITVEELTEGGSSAVWTPTGQVGKFLAFVRLTFEDESIAAREEKAPGFIRISTAPQIIWVGSFAEVDEDEESAGAIFEGHQFEDNLGSAFSPVGDLDGDGNDEFLMVARYAKPFFQTGDGIGHGEAYLIYGSRDRLGGRHNVNSVGTENLRGVTFTGIRTPQGNTETDGLSDVSRIPDVDGDDKDELVFGFPDVDSRGHNVDPDQDGVRPEWTLGTLEKHDQFLRGGLVIVSSTNSILKNPDSGTPVINLDMVGQDFDETCVLYEPGTEDDMVLDVFSIDADTGTCFRTDGLPNGSCGDAASGDGPDATMINWGFVAALSEDYFSAMRGSGCLTQYDYHLNACLVLYPDGVVRYLADYCAGVGPGCYPTSPALHGFPGYHVETTLTGIGYSGYYPDMWDNNDDGDPNSVSEEDIVANEPRQPFGARIIGVGLEDGFGTWITLSDPTDDDSGAGDIIVSAPNRTARGILYQQGATWDSTWPETGGEIDGLERPAGSPATNQDSGVAYMFDLRSLWTEDDGGRIPPKPHQYVVGEPSHCGRPPGGEPRIANITAIRIAGAANENITNILGIKDFNGDGRNDFAVGAPLSDRVYIAFRRETAIEGDYVLERLELGVDDPERLSGALITGATGSEFAFSMATDVDLNGDDVPDLIVSAPGANGDIGEVAIIYSSPELITGEGGTYIDTLVAQGRAAKITGRDPGDYFGFNVTSAGDIDGDGKNDLLIAAPGATPRFDSAPDDDTDTLDRFGLDLDGDGELDNLTGPNGVPEGEDQTNDDYLDELHDAGLVYVIWGSNVIEGQMAIADLGGSGLEGAIIVGRRGQDPAAGRAGDFFSGGDAGDSSFGGVSEKEDRGRSFGLRAAGDVDGDGLADILIGSVTATPRIDPTIGQGTTHGGEAYVVYGFER